MVFFILIRLLVVIALCIFGHPNKAQTVINDYETQKDISDYTILQSPNSGPTITYVTMESQTKWTFRPTIEMSTVIPDEEYEEITEDSKEHGGMFKTVTIESKEVENLEEISKNIEELNNMNKESERNGENLEEMSTKIVELNNMINSFKKTLTDLIGKEVELRISDYENKSPISKIVDQLKQIDMHQNSLESRVASLESKTLRPEPSTNNQSYVLADSVHQHTETHDTSGHRSIIFVLIINTMSLVGIVVYLIQKSQRSNSKSYNISMADYRNGVAVNVDDL